MRVQTEIDEGSDYEEDFLEGSLGGHLYHLGRLHR
tara:strand:+ start:372 stop:476 length:105 start_codon:yes stop_codon:yes gene_type:complete